MFAFCNKFLVMMFDALLVEMEMERNCLENSSMVSFSKMMAPPPSPAPSTRSRYSLSTLLPGGT